MISAFFSQFKMYFYLAALVAIVGACWYVKSVFNERDELLAENEIQKDSIKTLSKSIKDSAEQALKDNADAIRHLQKLEELERDKNHLKSQLSNNTKRVYINATCPKLPQLPSIESHTGPSIGQTPELTGTAKEGVADTYYGIDFNEKLIADLQARVIEDYEKCGMKLGQK